MEVHKIKSRKAKSLKFEIEGKLYTVEKPSYGELMEFRDKSEKDNVRAEDIVIELINRNGLPKEVLFSLHSDEVTQIVEMVIGTKKI